MERLSQDCSFLAVMTGAGISVTGGTLTLSGTNSFTVTTISRGTLVAGSTS